MDRAMKPEPVVRLTPGKRVLFLTKDPELIRRQLRGELDLTLADLRAPDDLLDDINTDAMTPAWVCFHHRPEDLAREAYAGLVVDGERLFPRDALYGGNFEVIVSGLRKGVGSSRETATQAEKWSGIRLAVAESFAPIHAANNVNQGVLMTGYDDPGYDDRRAPYGGPESYDRRGGGQQDRYEDQGGGYYGDEPPGGRHGGQPRPQPPNRDQRRPLDWLDD